MKPSIPSDFFPNHTNGKFFHECLRSSQKTYSSFPRQHADMALVHTAQAVNGVHKEAVKKSQNHLDLILMNLKMWDSQVFWMFLVKDLAYPICRRANGSIGEFAESRLSLSNAREGAHFVVWDVLAFVSMELTSGSPIHPLVDLGHMINPNIFAFETEFIQYWLRDVGVVPSICNFEIKGHSISRYSQGNSLKAPPFSVLLIFCHKW